MHQPQTYMPQSSIECAHDYLAMQNCQQYPPARTLPSAPTLPSTPAMSRPGSADSSAVYLASPRSSSQRVAAPQDFPNLAMDGKELSGAVAFDRPLWTPTTPPLSTESSRWGTPMADPMLSGLDAGASKPGPMYAQADPQIGIDYFNGKIASNHTSGSTSVPTTPGLTPDPASPQATFCNPQDLSVSAQPSPAFVPSQPYNFAFDASLPGTPPLPAAPLPESPLSQPLTPEDWALLNDALCESPETPVANPRTKPPHDMAPATSDEPATKKVKTEDGATPIPETEDVKAEEKSVIPGPPPQNRRGRKQSFSNDPTKQFACRICDRRFRRQEHLKRHHRSLHTHDKPFKCDECGKSFSRSDNLAQHHRTHGSGNIPLDIVGSPFPAQAPAMHMGPFAGLLFQVGATIPGGGNGPQVVDAHCPDGLPVLANPAIVGADPHTGLVPI